MDEQRILEEMERMLAADDPRLAARLAAFGQPGVGQVLRTRRARAVLSLLMIAVIAAAASVIYMMSAFHINPANQNNPHEVRTAAPAAPATTTLPVHQTVQLPGKAYCAMVKIAPRACPAWTAGKP
jgi:hypothetical protein